MRSCIVFGVLALICGSQAATSPLIQSLLARNAVISPAADPPPDPKAICNGGFGNKCLDCYTMLTCLGPNLDPEQTACSPERQFCNRKSNVCVSERPADADCLEPPKTTFTCSASEGFFPHPTNCSQYFECLNYEASNLHCPPGYSWTTNGMGCKQRKVTADCGTITCKVGGDKQVPLSNNATFYGFCNVENTLENIVVMKCPGRLVHTAGHCAFVCAAEGLFVDDEDPTSYYECYKSGTKTIWERKQCTHGRNFNEAEQLCVAPEAGQGDPAGAGPSGRAFAVL